MKNIWPAVRIQYCTRSMFESKSHKQDDRGAVANFQVKIIIKARDASDGDVSAVDQSNGIERS